MSRNRKSWYLGDVKEKENRSWTTSEKIRVYALRQYNPVEDIAKMFDTNTNQVYNIARMVKKGLEGRCYRCGRPNEPKLVERSSIEKRAYEIFLTGSQDAKTNWDQAEKELQLEAGYSLCSQCKETLVKYKRKLRRHALKKGLCGYCHKRKVVEGRKACIRCLSATHRRREKIGLCGACGKNPIANKGGALCEGCLEQDRIRTTNYRKGKKVSSVR
jgi:transposase-like protein